MIKPDFRADCAEFWCRYKRWCGVLEEEPDFPALGMTEDAGSVIGFVGVMRGLAFELDGEYIRVIALAVSRAYQSHGIGSKLEARVEQYAAETGANSIVISSGLNRNRAHVFYCNKGYEKKGYSFIKRMQPDKKFSYEDVIYTPIPSRLGRTDNYDNDCRIRTGAETLIDLVTGKLDAVKALEDGKISVDGDIEKAQVLSDVLKATVNKKSSEVKKPATASKPATSKKATNKKASSK